MIEKVNPAHPDKIADRIAGAIVDLAYKTDDAPKIAVEVLIGHGYGHVVIETSAPIDKTDVAFIVERLAPGIRVFIQIVPQDVHLAENQAKDIRCGDNGIFKGMPLTEEQKEISKIAREIYSAYPFDGKYILDEARLILCQSHVATSELKQKYPHAEVNPLSDWTGGIDVDSGATNRKLGSDMADSVTGGGLHGKDLSKADVTLNIYAFLKAQETGEPVTICCAIGDNTIDGHPYAFSSKIICSECGNTFKRRIHSCATYKYVAWTCNTHIDDKNACSMKYIYDEELKAAFITMMNKLIYSHKFLLKPYLKVLENSSGEEAVQRIQHLERLLEQNSEQRETLTKLMAQGYIDQILYNQEMNALLLQADSYRSDIETITTSMTGDAAKVTETAMLLQFVSHSEMLTEYSEELFEEFADHIEVQSRNEVRFILKCGLTFTERMGD